MPKKSDVGHIRPFGDVADGARKSVLAAVGDQGVAKMMKMYTDAGVIGVTSFHFLFDSLRSLRVRSHLV